MRSFRESVRSSAEIISRTYDNAKSSLCGSEKSASVEDAAIVFAEDGNSALTLEKRVQRLETLARNGPRAAARPKRPTKRALLEEIKKSVDELSKGIQESKVPVAQKQAEKATTGRGMTPRRTRGPPSRGRPPSSTSKY
ncbi:unnamed protein product [Oikopleura dioica]|uniref:Uncharacterized protein n=1 Tax=Oikopleura dioica TaxID=34765 RepID=E4YFC5_OIKDI|nr:unnamed protein product [Oikopleura dioica]